MLDLGPYLLGVVKVAVLAASLGFASYRIRQRLFPSWDGSPARLVEIVVAVALLTWISQILGTLTIFYGATVIAAAIVLAGLSLLLKLPTPARPSGATVTPAGGVVAGVPRGAEDAKHPSTVGEAATTGPAGRTAWSLVALAVVALVVFLWAITTKNALDRGIFNFDSLWYHMPFAVEMVQSHSLTGMWHTETVFTNWFYPQNSELLHAVGIALTERDTLSLFLNFGWLAVAFLAAWVIGRPYGRGQLCVVAVAILLACHTVVVRAPGAAKNDVMAAALLLAAIAILVEAWNRRPAAGGRHSSGSTRQMATTPGGGVGAGGGGARGRAGGRDQGDGAGDGGGAHRRGAGAGAPAGRRWAVAGWWFVPALLGGGFWYLRNLVVAGNPLPAVESIGPLTLPHPERLQIGRPDFNIAHYATDTGVWSEYFAPGLENAFGALWPLVVGGAVLAALWALFGGRDRIVRGAGAVALVGMLAYLFTPLSAAGAEGEPVGFAINVRFVVPALLVGLALLPLPRALDPPRRQWGLMAALAVVFLLTDRPDEALRDPSRPFALLFVVLVVVIPAALLLRPAAWQRPRPPRRRLRAALVLAVVAIGYPVQRDYLDARFANAGPEREWIPGMDLDSAYRWARGVEDARIGLAGTSAGFAAYGFYGTDLSNRVRYLGVRGPHGAFNAIPDCAGFRAAVNAAEVVYLVTAPFLNFLHPGQPVPSPEARWLRGERAVSPLLRSGPVTVWEVEGELDPAPPPTRRCAKCPTRRPPEGSKVPPGRPG